MELKLENLLQKSRHFECDSRNIGEGDVFFALKGERVDGHDFLDEAFENGASYVIISDKKKERENTILVDNVYESLYELALKKRKIIGAPLIAITGSAGKTTTKNLIVEVLSKKYKIGFNKSNYNSSISVPLQLLNLDNEYDFLVFEIGASKLGDIRSKCDLLKPSFGLITNVGHMHLETFGSLENIFFTKTELYKYLKNNSGKAFVNSSEKKLLEYAKSINLEAIFYQNQSDRDYISLSQEDPFLWYRCGVDVYETHLFGRYHLENIAAAYCLGKYFAVSENDIHSAITTYIPGESRSQKISTLKNNNIILDAYNANLDAIIIGLETFDKVVANNKIVILGSMKETANQTINFHTKIGEKLKECNFSEIILVGEEMEYAKKVCENAILLKNSGELRNFVERRNYVDVDFFVKGAKFWQLWNIVNYL